MSWPPGRVQQGKSTPVALYQRSHWSTIFLQLQGYRAVTVRCGCPCQAGDSSQTIRPVFADPVLVCSRLHWTCTSRSLYDSIDLVPRVPRSAALARVVKAPTSLKDEKAVFNQMLAGRWDLRDRHESCGCGQCAWHRYRWKSILSILNITTPS